MSDQPRPSLKFAFSNTKKPSGEDFADLIDSCVNKSTDGVSFDADGNLHLNRGVQLGDSNGTVAGGLRFDGTQLQLFSGGAWTNVSGGGGGGGAFTPPQPVAAPTAVAHDGNVGIGNFAAAAPTFRLEVNLGANSGPGEQVRFGNVVCAGGTGTFTGAAVFSHRNHATDTSFALRQRASGAVDVNAATGQLLRLGQNGAARLTLSTNGRVLIGTETEQAGAAGTALLQVAGAGTAWKNDGTADWNFTSDARVKEDVRDLELGLAELRQIRTVRYRYNGRGGTTAGLAGVGILAQEIEPIFPETISRGVPQESPDPELDDLRIFNPSMLRYVLINAVKELATRVEQLEQALAVATAAGPEPAIK